MVTQDTPKNVAHDFELRYGQPPSGVWSAPGRVNLIGEHTDYNQGFVLPLAIQYQATVAAGPRSDGKLCIASRQLGEVELQLNELKPRQQASWWFYAAGAVWSVAQHIAPQHRSDWQASGLQLVIDSDVPVGAGLSSSAAIECAVALAAAHLAGVELDAPVLARVAHRAEYEFVGVPCGTMDQTISACARAGSALLIDCRSDEQQVVPLDFAAAALRLVVIDTCAPHRLVDGEYAERRQTCEAAARALGLSSLRAATLANLTAGSLLTPVQLARARHVVTENERVLAAVEALSRRDFQTLGKLMTASHVSLRDDFQVTVPELDEAVESALSAGALGARMTGGGFGGSVLALCPAAREQELEAAVRAGFERRGFAAPQFFVAEASQGAKRLR